MRLTTSTSASQCSLGDVVLTARVPRTRFYHYVDARLVGIQSATSPTCTVRHAKGHLWIPDLFPCFCSFWDTTLLLGGTANNVICNKQNA
eukprot:1638264-Amphidinium_carterae.1